MDPRAPVAITVFPHDDHALRAHAETIMGSVRDPDEFERRLRGVYPAAVVREQDFLARLGPGRWYVYRDGSALPAFDGTDWDAPDVGTMFISRAGHYLSADQAAADIYGVPVEAIPGAAVGSFTQHEGNDEGGRRAFDRLAETGSLISTAVVRTPEGLEWPIDYRIDLEGDAYRLRVRRREAS